jgi:hypothetical protein
MEGGDDAIDSDEGGRLASSYGSVGGGFGGFRGKGGERIGD